MRSNEVAIEKEKLFKLRDIVRKIIVELIDMGYYQKEKTFDDLKKKYFVRV